MVRASDDRAGVAPGVAALGRRRRRACWRRPRPWSGGRQQGHPARRAPRRSEAGRPWSSAPRSDTAASTPTERPADGAGTGNRRERHRPRFGRVDRNTGGARSRRSRPDHRRRAANPRRRGVLPRLRMRPRDLLTLRSDSGFEGAGAGPGAGGRRDHGFPGAAPAGFPGVRRPRANPDAAGAGPVPVAAAALDVAENDDVMIFGHHEGPPRRRLGVALATAVDTATARDRAGQEQRPCWASCGRDPRLRRGDPQPGCETSAGELRRASARLNGLGDSSRRAGGGGSSTSAPMPNGVCRAFPT